MKYEPMAYNDMMSNYGNATLKRTKLLGGIMFYDGDDNKCNDGLKIAVSCHDNDDLKINMTLYDLFNSASIEQIEVNGTIIY